MLLDIWQRRCYIYKQTARSNTIPAPPLRTYDVPSLSTNVAGTFLFRRSPTRITPKPTKVETFLYTALFEANIFPTLFCYEPQKMHYLAGDSTPHCQQCAGQFKHAHGRYKRNKLYTYKTCNRDINPTMIAMPKKQHKLFAMQTYL